MPSDIYGTQEPPIPTRKKHSAGFRSRTEYLRASGEAPAPHHQRHSRGHRHRSFRQKVAFFGFGVLALLTVLSIVVSIWLAVQSEPVEDDPALNRPVLNGRGVNGSFSR